MARRKNPERYIGLNLHVFEPLPETDEDVVALYERVHDNHGQDIADRALDALEAVALKRGLINVAGRRLPQRARQ